MKTGTYVMTNLGMNYAAKLKNKGQSMQRQIIGGGLWQSRHQFQ
jgi:hypothetical protein